MKKIQNENTSAKIVYVFDNWIALPLRFYSNEVNFSMQVEKPDSAGDIPEKNFWLVLRFPIAQESYNLPEALQQRKCRIVERNDYFDDGQRVSVFKMSEIADGEKTKLLQIERIFSNKILKIECCTV